MANYNKAQYRNNRKALLAGGPPCCVPDCKARATEADHIIPASRGGSDALGNLRPMCKSHNSSRGNRVKIFHRSKW